MVKEEKQNNFCFPGKNFEASGDFLNHEIAYVPTLPFERTAPVFPFLPEICRFEKILAEKSNLFKFFQVDHTFYTLEVKILAAR